MAGNRRSVVFDFLRGRTTASQGADEVADSFERLGDRLERSGKESGKRFTRGLGDGLDQDRNRFQGALKKLITPNPELFTALRAPIARGLSTPLGLGLAAAISQALIVALPPAILAATGAGLVALGAFAVKGSTMLKRHFKAAGNVIQESLRQAALPLRGPFLQAIETVTGAMLQLQPVFRGLFKGMAPAIQAVTNGFVGFMRNALSGLSAALPGINAAFAQIGARLPGLGKTLGGFLAAISDNLPALTKGIDLLFTFAEVAINVAGAVLTMGQRVTQTFENIKAAVPPIIRNMLGWSDSQKDAASSAETLANNEGHLAIQAQKVAAHHATVKQRLDSVRQAFYQERQAVASVIPMFEGYQAKSGVTKQKVMANLREEVGAYKTWASDAQRLLKRGADPEVVRQLSLKGPEYVHAFVNASDRELASMSKMMKARIQAAGTIAKIQGRIMGQQIGEAIERALEAAFHPTLRVPSVRSPAAGIKSGKSVHSVVGAAGAIVRRPTMALIGEAGPEALVPLNRTPGNSPLPAGGMGGITVNVYAHPTNNPVETGRQVYEVLQRYMTANGRSLAS